MADAAGGDKEFLSTGSIIAIVGNSGQYWLAEVLGCGGGRQPDIRWLDKKSELADGTTQYAWCVGRDVLDRTTLLASKVKFNRRPCLLGPEEASRLARLRKRHQYFPTLAPSPVKRNRTPPKRTPSKPTPPAAAEAVAAADASARSSSCSTTATPAAPAGRKRAAPPASPAAADAAEAPPSPTPPAKLRRLPASPASPASPTPAKPLRPKPAPKARRGGKGPPVKRKRSETPPPPSPPPPPAEEEEEEKKKAVVGVGVQRGGGGGGGGGKAVNGGAAAKRSALSHSEESSTDEEETQVVPPKRVAARGGKGKGKGKGGKGRLQPVGRQPQQGITSINLPASIQRKLSEAAPVLPTTPARNGRGGGGSQDDDNSDATHVVESPQPRHAKQPDGVLGGDSGAPPAKQRRTQKAPRPGGGAAVLSTPQQAGSARGMAALPTQPTPPQPRLSASPSRVSDGVPRLHLDSDALDGLPSDRNAAGLCITDRVQQWVDSLGPVDTDRDCPVLPIGEVNTAPQNPDQSGKRCSQTVRACHAKLTNEIWLLGLDGLSSEFRRVQTEVQVLLGDLYKWVDKYRGQHSSGQSRIVLLLRETVQLSIMRSLAALLSGSEVCGRKIQAVAIVMNRSDREEVARRQTLRVYPEGKTNGLLAEGCFLPQPFIQDLASLGVVSYIILNHHPDTCLTLVAVMANPVVPLLGGLQSRWSGCKLWAAGQFGTTMFPLNEIPLPQSSQPYRNHVVGSVYEGPVAPLETLPSQQAARQR